MDGVQIVFYLQSEFLYNDQRNVQVFKFILFIYSLLPYMFQAFF
jgi:hypothetical protein